MNPVQQPKSHASLPTHQPLDPSHPKPSPQVGGTTSPYDFILETQHKPKKIVLKGGSFKSRILLVLGGGVLAIVAVLIISSLINGSRNASVAALTSLTAEQQELVRVADYGLRTSKDSNTVTFAETTRMSVSSQQKKLVDYLKSKSVVITPAILASGLNSKTDATLVDASTRNEFDSVFMSSLRASLVTYANNLQKSYNNASNPTSKAILNESYRSTAVLLK